MSKKFIFCNLLIIIVIIIHSFFILKPQLENRQNLKKQIQKFQDDKNLRINFPVEKDNLSHMINLLIQEMAGYLQHLNQSTASNNFISQLFQIAEESQLSIVTLQPEQWEIKQGLNMQHFCIQATGTFSQWLSFVNGLSNTPLILYEFTLSPAESGTLKIDMKLIGAFVDYDTPFPIYSPAQHYISITQDPFYPELNSPSGKELQEFPLKQIQFVGYIFDAKQFWGLAKLPNQLTLPIYSGMTIGSENAKIEAITEKTIQVKIANKLITFPYLDAATLHQRYIS